MDTFDQFLRARRALFESLLKPAGKFVSSRATAQQKVLEHMDNTWKELSTNLKQNAKVQLIQTKNAGRGLVAIENIQREGEIIKETALVVGPPQSIGPHFCVNCSQPLTNGLLEGKIGSQFYKERSE